MRYSGSSRLLRALERSAENRHGEQDVVATLR